MPFLECCRDEGIIPKNTELIFHKKTMNILRRVILALIREANHDTRRLLVDANRKLLYLHFKLSSTLHQVLWIPVGQLSDFRTQTDAELTTPNQKKKFERLKQIQKPEWSSKPLDIIEAGTQHIQLPIRQCSGECFEQRTQLRCRISHIPVEDIIWEVEAAISNIPHTSVESICQDIERIFRKICPPSPKKNLTKEEYLAL